MTVSENFSEIHEVLATIAPTTANGTVAAHGTGYFDMAEFHRVFVFVQVGEPGAAGSTIDIAVNEATDLDGTGEQAIAALAATQIDNGDTGAYVGMEIRQEDLSQHDGYHCINVVATVGTNTYTFSLAALGYVARYDPADVTGYAELITA
jgi:hypothetical protein